MCIYTPSTSISCNSSPSAHLFANMMSCFSKTSFIELKTVQKCSHVRGSGQHGHGTWLWKRKNVSFPRCQTSESDRASIQQWRKTQEVRAMKEKAVSAAATATATTTAIPVTVPNTSISNGIGILQFLAGKTYFVTGATGFLAKAVVEKILRTAPDVAKIFLLIKARSHEDAVDRLKAEVIDSELFQRLKQKHGKYYEDFMLSKLVPVVGSMCEPDLGMDANLMSEIAEKVDVIINSAANTDFMERLDVSLNVNTLGARRIMDFARTYCKNLRVFLHVSTAYVNGEREGVIMEKPFHMGESIAKEKATSVFPPLSYHVLNVDSELERAFDSKVAFEGNLENQKMKELGFERARIHGWHNTYEFTKAMGEMVMDSMREDIPLVIIRPTVIESALEDPFPGWIQGNRTLDSMILSYGKGNLPGFLLNPEAVVDVIPVDIVVNAMIAAIAKHGIARKPDTKVYHVASSVVNPLLLGDLFKYSYQHFNRSPINMDTEDMKEMKFFSSMDDFSSHIQTELDHQKRMLSISGDGASQRLQKKYKVAMQHAIHLARASQPYTFFRARFDNSNTHDLMEGMSDEEMKRFRIEVESLDWEDYITNIHIPGLKKHVVKCTGIAK